jgi:hypothetical protein
VRALTAYSSPFALSCFHEAGEAVSGDVAHAPGEAFSTASHSTGPESDLKQTEFALKAGAGSEGQDRATRSGSHARGSTDRLTVFLTDQNFRTADSTSKVETVEHKAGDVAWGRPSNSEQNLGNEPFEAMAVEVK